MQGRKENCSRCNNPIVCKSNDIVACDCSKIVISQETADHLRETNFKCLCNNCLTEVDKLVNLSQILPTKATEGIHYIMENGLLVFTELNHIQRGYCCGSNCRNCAYGFLLATNK